MANKDLNREDLSSKSNKFEKKEKKLRKKTEKKRRKLEKKANKKPMNKVLKGILLTIAGFIVAGGITAVIIGTIMFNYVVDYKNSASVLSLETYRDEQNQTSILLYTDQNCKRKELTRLHGTENRVWVDYDEIPENLIWAFVCLEDKRFFDHNGVDWLRTAKAFISDSNQGGSTLTQQLIKNLTKQNEATFIRKFNEITRALNLEKYYKKKEILEAYLNTIYLGAGCYGVKTAAETYFGKELDELTIAECAMLAGITQNPYMYNLFSNLEGAKDDRQWLALQCMLEQGKITQKQRDKAWKAKIKLADRNASKKDDVNTEIEIQSYYVDYVIDEVIADLQKEFGYDYQEAWRQVYCGGLTIETACDLDAQEKLENIYENRIGFPYAIEREGKLPESAATVMDYQGRIVAIVGGTGKKTLNRSLNRASSSFRQPGSSMKPLSVYGPCIDMGIITSPTTTVLNQCITLPDGSDWPRNYAGDKGSGKFITVETAVAQSLNTTAARLLNETIGVENSYKYVTERFHLAHLTASDKDLSPLAVGGTNGGVSTLEMASAYAVFGNGGRYYEPYSYYRVLDRDGKVILDNTNPKYEEAMSERAADLMRRILNSVVYKTYGTAYGCGVSGLETFAKTGTTTDNNDKWTCIGTPYYVCAIWYGYDQQANIGNINLRELTKAVLRDLHEGLSTKRTFDTVKKELSD